MIVIGLLILAFWIGFPCYLVGILLFYRWKRRWPGLVFWIVNPLVAALWLFSVVLIAIGHKQDAAPTDQTTSTDQATSTDSTTPTSSTRTLNLPGWDSSADGNTWLNYSEADKQKFCASSAVASSNHHTAAFFYTNVNAAYDPTNPNGLKFPLIALFLKLDSISPAVSYPSFQGFTWQRIDLQHMAQGDVKMILVCWQDGHSFIHDQQIQPDGSYTEAGLDGPWDGDAATYTATTTVSGNKFTIKILGSNPSSQSGTFQVSADSQELDLMEDGRPPARYTEVAELVNSIDDIK